METVVGIFPDSRTAGAAVQTLQRSGFGQDALNLLAPGAPADRLRAVPTDEGEQPGMGEAVGAVVGAGLGTSGGAALGMATSSLLLPGVGPVVAVGVTGAALLGLLGAAGGAVAGHALEDALSNGVPKDTWFVYEDALRQGRTIAIVTAENDAAAESARAVLSRHGAESVDAARERWWIGLRSAEAERYHSNGGDFSAEEKNFRAGFEAALDPETRGRPYNSVTPILRQRYPVVYDQRSFREGYERGRNYRAQS